MEYLFRLFFSILFPVLRGSFLLAVGFVVFGYGSVLANNTLGVFGVPVYVFAIWILYAVVKTLVSLKEF
jgi:hypothetical protein